MWYFGMNFIKFVNIDNMFDRVYGDLKCMYIVESYIQLYVK